MKGTLMSMVCTMLHQSKLNLNLWAEALRTATFTLNRLPTTVLPNNMTPYERWTHDKPNLSRLKTFGCWAWAVVPLKGCSKLAECAQKCIFVGYEPKGYRLLRANTNEVFCSRNVYFDEKNLPGSSVDPTTPPPKSTIWTTGPGFYPEEEGDSEDPSDGSSNDEEENTLKNQGELDNVIVPAEETSVIDDSDNESTISIVR